MTLTNSSASAEFPNTSSVFSHISQGVNDSFVLELSENTNVPLRYSEGAKNLAKDSAIVSVNIQKHPGDNSPPEYVTLDAPPIPILYSLRPKRQAVSRHAFTVRIPGKSAEPPQFKKIVPMLTSTTMYQLHEVYITRNGSSLHATLCIEQPDVRFVVVFSLGSLPNHIGHCNASFVITSQTGDCQVCKIQRRTQRRRKHA